LDFRLLIFAATRAVSSRRASRSATFAYFCLVAGSDGHQYGAYLRQVFITAIGVGRRPSSTVWAALIDSCAELVNAAGQTASPAAPLRRAGLPPSRVPGRCRRGLILNAAVNGGRAGGRDALRLPSLLAGNMVCETCTNQSPSDRLFRGWATNTSHIPFVLDGAAIINEDGSLAFWCSGWEHE
jgi:hypothetical protein